MGANSRGKQGGFKVYHYPRLNQDGSWKSDHLNGTYLAFVYEEKWRRGSIAHAIEFEDRHVIGVHLVGH
jgi:hypothetical protein